MRSCLRIVLVILVGAAAGPSLALSASTTTTAPPIIPPVTHRTHPATKPEPPVAVPTRDHPLDINTASQRELAVLPGVGVDGAKRIVEGRPYTTVADLARAGLPKQTLERIGPLVRVGGAGGLSTPMGAADTPMSPAPPPKSPGAPHPGMVW
jgi:competence protein ComEA